VSGSYSDEYRNVVQKTLHQVEALIPHVKRCADSTGQINELADKRDRFMNEWAQQQATLSRNKRKSLRERADKLTEQVDDLYRPLPETEKKIFALVQDLGQTLMSCPLEKPFLDIRSELRHLGLLNISKTWPPVSFNNSYRDLLVVQQRLREMNSLLNAGIGNRRLLSLPIPPGTTWADVSIRFLSDNRIQIKAPECSAPLNCLEAGFEDARKNVPNLAWNVLRELAINSGELQRPNVPGSQRQQIVSLEKSVEAIRKRLKQLFGIDEDPFYPYREVKCYRTKFRISFPNPEQN
jgi:polyhydroxyalkanoate synthesis regulator phasin